MYETKDGIYVHLYLINCSNCLMTYYWRIVNTKINTFIYHGVPYVTNSIFWRTNIYCHHDIDIINQQIGLKSSSSYIINLN